MVTLLGFLFIVGNVMLIGIFMPDLIGPVSIVRLQPLFLVAILIVACNLGPLLALLQFCLRPVDVSYTSELWMCWQTKLTSSVLRYSTLDNVDGKQARRTGTSSPLGELFEFVPSKNM